MIVNSPLGDSAASEAGKRDHSLAPAEVFNKGVYVHGDGKYNLLYITGSRGYTPLGIEFYPMRPDRTLSARVRDVLQECGDGGKPLTYQDLADIAGCSKGRVNQWINEVGQKISWDHAKAIESRLHYGAQWLREGTGPKRIDQAVARVYSAMAGMDDDTRKKLAAIAETLTPQG